MRTIENLKEVFQHSEDDFVQRLYRELLKRNPDTQHRKLYTRRLKRGAAKHDILKAVVSTREFRKALRASQNDVRIHAKLRALISMGDYDFVTGTYRLFLGRRPTNSELHDSLHQLAQGTDRTHIVQGLLTKGEIYSEATRGRRAPGHSMKRIISRLFRRQGRNFLDLLYRELLGRNPSASEIRRNLGSATSLSSKWKIWTKVVNSDEFNSKLQQPPNGRTLLAVKLLMNRSSSSFVHAMYREFLGRDADPQGLRVYRKLARAGHKDEVVKSILSSNELRQRLQSDYQAQKELQGDSEELWPEIPLNAEFRAKIEELLRNEGFPYQARLLVCEGGLGDFIQLTAIAKALKLRDPNIPIVTLTDYKEVYDEHPYVDYAIEAQVAKFESTEKHMVRVKSLIGLVETVFDIRYISRGYGNWQDSDYFREHQELYDLYRTDGWRHDLLHMHVVDQMLASLGLEAYASSEDTVVVPAPVDIEVPGDYVIVNDAVGSKPGQLKKWRRNDWNALINWLISEGITPVQLGVDDDALLSPRVVDLRGKTTSRQAATYLKNSRGFIGVEGGLFHLSKAVGAPAVVVFSSTSPETFAYKDTRVVTRGLCRPCWWTKDWQARRCMYGYPSCINLPDWRDVAKAVSEMLREGGNHRG